MSNQEQNYIDGLWCEGGAGRIDVIDPGTGKNFPNMRWPMRLMWIARSKPLSVCTDPEF